MKAIRTKYHGPSAVQGSRISATADGWGRCYISYPHQFSTERAHFEAVLALMAKVNKGQPEERRTPPPTIYGGLPDGSYAWTYADSDIEQDMTIADRKEEQKTC
jgi:hypothetical protein